MKTTATTTRFENRLGAIREASRRRRAQSAQQRSQAALVRSGAIVASFQFLERVEQLVADCVEGLAEAVSPQMKLTQRFFDSRYELAVRLEELVRDPDGRPLRVFSRLALLLEPDSATGRLTIECRTTVRNRDLESTLRTESMDDAGLAGLHAFLEQSCLVFAQAWFSDEHRPVA